MLFTKIYDILDFLNFLYLLQTFRIHFNLLRFYLKHFYAILFIIIRRKKIVYSNKLLPLTQN